MKSGVSGQLLKLTQVLAFKCKSKGYKNLSNENKRRRGIVKETIIKPHSLVPVL